MHHEVEASTHEGDESEEASARSSTMRRLRAVHAAVPILTGAMLVADERLGEQQRPMQVVRGAAERFVPDTLRSLPDTLHSVSEKLHA